MEKVKQCGVQLSLYTIFDSACFSRSRCPDVCVRTYVVAVTNPVEWNEAQVEGVLHASDTCNRIRELFHHLS
eukprot:scaffold24543_cov195-Amphora_coffeaeformis.AAC.17